MKQYSIIALLCVMQGLGSCNVQQEIKQSSEIEYSSYNSSTPPGDLAIGMPENNSDSIVRQSMTLIGLSESDIEIVTTTEFSAYSMINRITHQRYFVYGPAFFDSVRAASTNNFPVMSICLHELGHLLYNHPLKSSEASKIFENQADRYSGYQMCIAGASLEESVSAMRAFGNQESTETHPAMADRLEQIAQGYREARIRVFKDSSYIKRDSAFKTNELILASKSLKQPEVHTADLEGFGFPKKRNKKQEVYNILGVLVYADKKHQLKFLYDNTLIGKISPAVNAGNRVLEIEGVKYVLEPNGEIYSFLKNMPRISVGQKIN